MRSDGFSTWPDVAPPVIILPTDPANVIGATGFTITINAFVASALTHNSTDYEIRTTPGNGGTLIWSSYNDAGLLLKVVPPLAVSTGTRYLRARFKTAAGQVSEWSFEKVLFVV